MRILVPFGHAELGGSQLFFLKTADLLGDVIEFHVWLDQDGPLRQELEQRSIPVEVWKGRPWKNPMSWPALVSALRSVDPDLVYLHATRFVAWLCLLSGIPCMERINMTRCQEAGGWMRYPLVDRVMTSFNTHILAVSEAIASQLRQGGTPPEKITVIRNHVEESRWRRPESRQAERLKFGLAEDDIFVLGAGRLVPQKAPEDFFRIGASLAQDPRMVFAWAGEGPLEGEIRTLITSLVAGGLPSRGLRLLPFQHDMAPLMNAADLLLHTSHWDPLANVILEAMATGLPVVASDVDGSGEALRKYPPSRLVKPGDLPGFSKAVTELAGIGIPAANLPQEFRPERFRREFLDLVSRVATSR
ncbi:MAG: glycosyltransferase [Planctomycetota bacterium]